MGVEGQVLFGAVKNEERLVCMGMLCWTIKRRVDGGDAAVRGAVELLEGNRDLEWGLEDREQFDLIVPMLEVASFSPGLGRWE